MPGSILGALLALRRYPDAEAMFATLAASTIQGHLLEDAALGEAEAKEAKLDFAGAVSVYERLLQRKLATPQVALWRLAVASQRNGDQAKAVSAYRRVVLRVSALNRGQPGRGRAHETGRVARGRAGERARVEAGRRAVPGASMDRCPRFGTSGLARATAAPSATAS